MNNIFFNLIQNAIKYSKPGTKPQIEIRSMRKENAVVLTIKDHGMGIDMKASDRVFGLYQRFHTHKDGRGMGLYLVKSQIESMGADIDIKSAVGKGTTFTITFYE
jgi:signal transduction histidine kinase